MNVPPKSDHDRSAALPQADASDSVAELSKGGWIVAARISSQISQFLIVILAVRFIAPADFGTFALLSAIGLGLTRVAEAGWREFIMSSKHTDSLAEIHCLAFVAGITIMAIGLLLSLAMELTDRGRDFATIMALLSVWALLATLTAVQTGILVKRGSFSVLGVTQIFGEVAGFAAAALVFYAGGGVIGLAIAKLLTQTVLFVGSLLASRWFGLRVPRDGRWREPLHFSMNILATRLIGYAHDNVALFAIGLLTGPTNAGLFRASGRLAGAMGDVINEPVRLVVWSMLQRRNGKDVINQLLGLTIIVATPLFVGLAIVSRDIILLFFGQEWAAATPMLIAFSIGGLFSLLNVVTEPLLASNGHVSLVPRLSIVYTLAAMAILVVTAPLGIFWIAIGQVLLSVLLMPLTLWIQHRYGGTSPLHTLKSASPALVGGTVLIIGVVLAGLLFPTFNPITLLITKVLFGAIGYCATIAVLVPLKTFKLDAAISPKHSDT